MKLLGSVFRELKHTPSGAFSGEHMYRVYQLHLMLSFRAGGVVNGTDTSNVLPFAGSQTSWMRSGICMTMRTRLAMQCLLAGRRWISSTGCDPLPCVAALSMPLHSFAPMSVMSWSWLSALVI